MLGISTSTFFEDIRNIKSCQYVIRKIMRRNRKLVQKQLIKNRDYLFD